jgi:hypothetical protein
MTIDLSLPSKSQLGRRAEQPTTDRVIAVGAALALAAILAQLLTQIVNFTVYDLRIGALNSDVHASVFGIMSLVAELAMAAAAAYRGLRSDHRTRWLGLAALVAALVAVRAALPGSATAFTAPVVVVFLLVWTLTEHDPGSARSVARGALFLLAFSFVVHAVGLTIVHKLGYGANTWPYEIKGLLKHTAELAGWMLLSTGVLAGTRRRSG